MKDKNPNQLDQVHSGKGDKIIKLSPLLKIQRANTR